ncbi:hypothetical protein SLEP1_g52913 [Rubroshorea leprosula]|uniref:Uncharacterized protein n=1 Tax=Rubroshorea leprosula TaxID=152421 RepID=A0AAV5M8K9_9ROSI|nr:hypothetical protein SLEP1_g52913 [Rubroshorea leprosula]
MSLLPLLLVALCSASSTNASETIARNSTESSRWKSFLPRASLSTKNRDNSCSPRVLSLPLLMSLRSSESHSPLRCPKQFPSIALQCHAISGKNGTCQDQDQEKASEEKESKSHKELPIDPKSDHDGSTKDVMSTERSGPSQVDQQNEGNALPSRTGLKQKDRKWKIWCKNYLEENSSDLTSDHNKGSENIKSDVVSTESSGSSTDVTVTTLVGGPVLSLINKRLRNQCKKFNRILHMEELLAQGKPLNKDQAQLLRSKPAIFALIDELEKLRNLLASTVSEEISLALQCHAISGKNDTSQDQDQDQEKASEEKESKAHKELPIDSRSGHKEESTKIKSDVLVSVVSQRFSSDVADTTLVGGPVLSLINKHLQNHCEKLNQILQVEEFLAQGKPLSTEQAQLLQSKSAVSAFIDELEKLRKPLASAVSEEISLALQCHAISGKSGTCQNQDQEKASEEKESKSYKELPIDPKSDHDGSTKDVMSTECSGPSQVDQQNEGNALPSRTGLKQKDRKWKIWCKNYLEENSRLLCKKMMLELEFESLKLSSVVYQLRVSLIDHLPTLLEFLLSVF